MASFDDLSAKGVTHCSQIMSTSQPSRYYYGARNTHHRKIALLCLGINFKISPIYYLLSLLA